jgi:hypothetical protein
MRIALFITASTTRCSRAPDGRSPLLERLGHTVEFPQAQLLPTAEALAMKAAGAVLSSPTRLAAVQRPAALGARLVARLVARDVTVILDHGLGQAAGL